jgi:hypothetical protein
MRIIPRLFLATVVVCYATMAQYLLGDSSPSVTGTTATSPLNVSVDRSGEPDLTNCGDGGVRNPVVLQMRYVGAKALRGYVVGLYFPESSAASQKHGSSIDVIFPNQRLIAPNSEWKRTTCALPEGGNPGNVVVKVDLLAFEDGSHWGPMALPESYKVLGACEGIDFVQGEIQVAKLVSPASPEASSVADEASTSTTLGPLELTPIVQHTDSGDARLTVQARNVGGSPVRGYVFKISFFDHATGNFIRSVSTNVLEMREEPSHYLAPGASWQSGFRKVPRSTDKAPAVYKLTLDLVVFGDDETLRTGKSPQADELLGMLQGMSQVKILQRRTQVSAE